MGPRFVDFADLSHSILAQLQGESPNLGLKRCPMITTLSQICSKPPCRLVTPELAKRLQKAAKVSGKQDLELRVFGAERGLGHSQIYRAQELPQLLMEYFDK